MQTCKNGSNNKIGGQKNYKMTLHIFIIRQNRKIQTENRSNDVTTQQKHTRDVQQTHGKYHQLNNQPEGSMEKIVHVLGSIRSKAKLTFLYC